MPVPPNLFIPVTEIVLPLDECYRDDDMSDKKETRGRKSGSGKYGCTTRIARIPAHVSDETLMSLFVLADAIGMLATDPPPYEPGTVRAISYKRFQAEVCDLMQGLGLSLHKPLLFNPDAQERQTSQGANQD